MKTTELHKIFGGSGSNFDRLLGSKLGQRYLAQARQVTAEKERAANEAANRFSTPHVEVVKRKIAQVLHESLVGNKTPALTKWDAAQTAVRTARENPRDFGLRRVALHLHKLWDGDKDGTLTVGDLAKLRAQYTGEYPKGMVRGLFDETLPKVAFHQLPVRQLRSLAASIRSQADYERVVEENGLAGSDATSQRARAFIRAQLRVDDCDHQVDESTGACLKCGATTCVSCGEVFLPADLSPDGLCGDCMSANVREPRGMEQEAVKPPNISEETMYELKDKEEKGEIDNAYAVAWEISKKKESSCHTAKEKCPECGEKYKEGEPCECGLSGTEKQAGDAADAGEQEFHPEVSGQPDDALKIKKEDAELSRSSRCRATISDVQASTQRDDLQTRCAQVETDDPEDIEMAHDIEDIVHKHIRENLPAEQEEGHLPEAQAEVVDPDVFEKRQEGGQLPPARKVSRARIESALLDGRDVQVGRYLLRLASRGQQDQVEMTAKGEPPMAWPIRRFSAAVEYFAKVVEAQSLEATEVNEQQPDAVKPPAAKNPLGKGDSSAEDIDSLETDSIPDSHPAQDQPGTSEPDSDVGEGVTEEDVKSLDASGIKPHHPATDQSGVSLTDTDLGRHSSDEEPPAFDVGKVSPGRSAKVDRAMLRQALRGTVKHVRGDEE